MNEQDDDRIRTRAYQLWEEEGRPEGKHEDHWQRASREIAESFGSGGQADGAPNPPSGISSNLHPGGTLPAGSNPGIGSIGTGGGSTAGEPTGSRSSDH